MGLAHVDGLLSLYRDQEPLGILKRTGRNFEEDDDIGLMAPGGSLPATQRKYC